MQITKGCDWPPTCVNQKNILFTKTKSGGEIVYYYQDIHINCCIINIFGALAVITFSAIGCCCFRVKKYK